MRLLMVVALGLLAVLAHPAALGSMAQGVALPAGSEADADPPAEQLSAERSVLRMRGRAAMLWPLAPPVVPGTLRPAGFALRRPLVSPLGAALTTGCEHALRNGLGQPLLI